MIEGVVFDAYGTLFDVHSVMDTCECVYPGYGEQISQIWRQKQLEYTWLRALMRRYVHFEAVTREALQFTLHHLNLTYDRDILEQLVSAYFRLRHYPEVPQALQTFLPRKLAILSNGTPHMLEAAVRNAGLTPFFDEILSVDSLQTYKPDPQVYQLATSQLGIAKERILFVSSNGWEWQGPKHLGLQWDGSID